MRPLILAAALLLHAMPAGAQIPKTAPIGTAKKAVATVDVPRVYDLSLSEAQKALTAVGLRCAAVRPEGGDPAPDDIVVRQIPQPEQRVAVIATACTLYVRPQYVQRTPRVIGRSLEDAKKLVGIAELKPTYSMVPSPDTALSSVIMQDPPPDAPIRPDRTIDLQIAGVPQVVGLTVEAATTTLERAHLTATTTVRDSTEGSDGTILEQSPGAGGPATPGSSVALTVVRVVEPPFEMPDLVGRPIAEAQRIITKSGLVSQGLEVAKEEGRPDTVVAQSPTVGTLVRRGDSVTLTNGRAITTVLVPDFVGARIDQLSNLDGAASLGVVPRFSEPARDANDSVVTGQSLAPGTRVRIGSTITLTVSRHEAPPAPEPNRGSDPPFPWWRVAVIAVGSAVLGWGAWRLFHPPIPPPPPVPPTPVPPPVFTYRPGARGTETEITETHGHGSELSLVSYAGESAHVLEPAGVELFNEEKTHG